MVAVADHERTSPGDYVCSECLGVRRLMHPIVESQVPGFTLPFQEDERYNLVPDWQLRNAEREASFKELTSSIRYRKLAP